MWKFRQPPLDGHEGVVERPVLALILTMCRQRHLGGVLGNRPQDRPLLVDEAELGVFLEQPRDAWRHGLAIRAEVIEELDDGGTSGWVAGDRGAGVVLQLVALGGKHRPLAFVFGYGLACLQNPQRLNDDLGILQDVIAGNAFDRLGLIGVEHVVLLAPRRYGRQCDKDQRS